MKTMNLANTLNQGLHALQLELSAPIQTQLLNYLELLAKWNQVYNLTAVRDVAQMIPKHVLDSLAVLPYIYGTPILDVGTGAGLPGLLLAIVRPDWQCVLLDSSAKKIRFVQQAIIELEIKNARAVCTRIETFNPAPVERPFEKRGTAEGAFEKTIERRCEKREMIERLKEKTEEKFGTIISRAYANLHRFYTQTQRLCATDGRLLAMKGIFPETELAQMAGLPAHLETIPLQVPQLQAQRHLIVMRPLTGVIGMRINNEK
ncbi:MAG TPA: 16S rRNA (guanine(527)-N(7))-methyltransferase RsmG [Thioploca sp.]|nr:16S rRNA (guanine(527)-N(7))-methyltransferase RsmG [Thioploca sp.]